MIRDSLQFAVYRMRTTFGQRWGGYLTVILLVGLLGGLGMGSLAGARRTQSSFSTFVASTNPSTLDVTILGADPASSGAGANYEASLTRQVAHLPHVASVAPAVEFTGAPLVHGAPQLGDTGEAYPVGSVNGLFFTQDRVALLAGHRADPARANEIMMSPSAAQLLGFHVGEVIPYGFYDQAQEQLPGIGTAAVTPALRIDFKLVGLAALNSGIIQDDVDRSPTFIELTPAFSREILSRRSEQFSGAILFGIRVHGAASAVSAVEVEIQRLVPAGVVATDHALGPVIAKSDLALKPLSIALGVFGAVSLLAALLVGAQVIARRMRIDGDDLDVLRALGADPLEIFADEMAGVLASILAGALLAAGFAILLSPIAPLGPVRTVYPTPGFDVDWTVLGVGVLVLVVLLSAFAAWAAYRGSPHRLVLRRRLVVRSGSTTVRTFAAAGLSASGVVGVRMALEPGQGRSAVPVRSVMLGATLAVALVIATITFGASLNTLVTRPPLYGWNWTYIVNQVGEGGANVPPQTLVALAHDRDVAAVSGLSYNDLEIDGQTVQFIQERASAAVTPPVLSGHAVEGARQVVLGAATLAQLHKRVGQTALVSYGVAKDAPLDIPPTRVTIVGTATFPAIGFASVVDDHTSMGTGVWLASSLLPEAFVKAMESQYSTLNGPNMALVRMKTGVSAAADEANLRQIVRSADRAFAAVPNGAGEGDALAVLGVQRPAEIVNYRSMGSTPALLVAALALGAVIALALTLVSSVRQRRREFALLKSIGFVRQQLALAIAWQATVAAVVGLVIGIPLGILAGRWLWTLFAQQIAAVPDPTVPALSVVLVAVGSLVFANIVAAVPARSAARTPAALMLREE
jgi:hypothetical protein